MPRIFSLTRYTPLRRKLRKQATRAENFLWYHLRNKKIAGYKFRRQHSMGRYILDFFCAEKMLGMEVDGYTHLDPVIRANDRVRQQWIEQHGVRVMRFTDGEVLEETEQVIEKIRKALLP